MPLRDHFRPPVDTVTAWESFHAQWPAVIVQALGKKLPRRYVAAPRAHVGAPIEIDVAAFDTEPAGGLLAETEPGGVATAVWAPALPTLAIETEMPDIDEFEVRIYDLKRQRRLVAAIELVSPANKDCPEHRRVFVAKCAALLQQRVAVSIVDLVTARDFSLYADLLELLGHEDPSLAGVPPALYAASCRWGVRESKRVLETWHHPMFLGQPLPTLPIWLTDAFAVPLELEASYEQTCQDLRIP